MDFIVSFGEDNAGNLYLVDYGNGFTPTPGTGEIFMIKEKPIIPGDGNGDGVLNNLDILSLFLALFDPEVYASTHPGLDPDVVLDMNNDGVLNNLDIAPFGAALGF